MTRADGGPAFDPSVVVSAITDYLLGETPRLTRSHVSEQSGVTPEVARERWRALGFPAVDDDVVAFTHADVEALQLTQKLIDLGIIEDDTEQAFIRTIGRTFARLAEWQVGALLASVIKPNAEISLERIDDILPVGEQIQSYIWRRHLVGAASRLLLNESTDAAASSICAGFADIVGYTTRSRRMSSAELAEMVDRFEEVVTGLITDHHGRVIKTIGDEVLFVVDEPKQAALLALELLDEHEHDDTFPEVRVGLAYGNVLSRLGDVYGPVVNLASRLTSVAKPGRAVTDRALAETLRDDDEFRLRRMTRVSVKGYEHLEPWSLKRPRSPGDPRPPLRQTIQEAFEDVTETVDGATRQAREAVELPRSNRRAKPSARRTRKASPNDQPKA